MALVAALQMADHDADTPNMTNCSAKRALVGMCSPLEGDRPAKRLKPNPGRPPGTDVANPTASTHRKSVGGAGAEADALRGVQLQEAYSAFQEQRSSRQLFLEVDVAAEVDPQQLVGRSLRVLWPDDEAWYLGTVTSFDPATGRHHVSERLCFPAAPAALKALMLPCALHELC